MKEGTQEHSIITMRDDICIAYGVLMIYLVKSLSEVGILLYIYERVTLWIK